MGPHFHPHLCRRAHPQPQRESLHAATFLECWVCMNDVAAVNFMRGESSLKSHKAGKGYMSWRSRK
uniref:Uncharacterized protein n=1 Tax=Setaria italica TaxID=4555 RepID=K3Z176_SETIT